MSSSETNSFVALCYTRPIDMMSL